MPGPLTCLFSYGLVCGGTTPVPPASPDAGAPVSTTVPAKADKPASLALANVQAFYDGSTDFRASFTQTYEHAVYGTKTISKGTLRVRRPDKMVWDYDEADNPDFWVAGDVVWVVERDTKQAIKRDIGGSDFAGAEKFLFGGSKLLDEFKVRLGRPAEVKRFGMKGHTVIELQPKTPNPHYESLVLVVEDGSGRVDGFAIWSSDDATNHFVLRQYERNTGAPAADFEFRKPKGFVEIVE